MKNDNLKEQYRINERIRVREVRLVGDNIETGVYPIAQALKIAEEQGMDLVEISPNAAPPVCRVIDYQKFLYVFFRGRSILFKEQGEVLLLRFANDLEDYGKVEQLPVLEGKRMIIMLTPKKAGTGSAPVAAAAPKVVKKVITTPKPKSEGDKKTEE